MISFAAHFTLAEFTAKSDRVPDAIEQQKAARLSQLCEVIRHALGDAPLVVTSWLRGADRQSAHLTGDAVDVRPRRDWSQRDIFDAVTTGLQAAGVDWGELIFYPFSDWHIHVTLYPVGGNHEVLIANATETAYATPTAGLIAELPATLAPFPPSQVVPALAVAVALGSLLALGAAVAA